MSLVGAGHSLREILNEPWQGQSYNGWPLLVFLNQVRAVLRFDARQRLNSLDDTVATNNIGCKDDKLLSAHKKDLTGRADNG